jgi:hypothetical protein
VLRFGAVGKRILRTHVGKEPSPKDYNPSPKANERIRIGIGEIFTEQIDVYLKVTKAFLKI